MATNSESREPIELNSIWYVRIKASNMYLVYYLAFEFEANLSIGFCEKYIHTYSFEN